jgi:hydrogenase maturation protein HypF
MALAYLYQSFGEKVSQYNLEFLKTRQPEDVKMILSMIKKGINSPLTSSAGRLFDAVSALLNLCTESGFDAEAPMKLESFVDPRIEDEYNFEMRQDQINFNPVFIQIIEDMQMKDSTRMIATKFHNTVARVVTFIARRVRDEEGINKVVLSGGTFQNKYLSETTARWLGDLNFEVYQNKFVPANDGGIALGQLAIAAKKRR